MNENFNTFNNKIKNIIPTILKIEKINFYLIFLMNEKLFDLNINILRLNLFYA
jgi:hypothetical protein